MIPAILFSLLIVLVFHLVKQHISKSNQSMEQIVSQSMPKIELREVGPLRTSTRYFLPKSRYIRIPLTQKERFFILKRDNFTCQYCGRKPPEVVLEVDHIITVYDGGTNDPDNLIASCLPCNRGKGIESLG
jgi:5-methylcytosine-specific restriction endonuclease McrA